jgi:Histidine kinase-like ATPase domain
MTAYARPLRRPVTGAVPRSRTPGSARPANVGRLRLCALPSAPFWARQYTRRFLAESAGSTAVSGTAARSAPTGSAPAGSAAVASTADTAQTAELIVSELVTNAACASASTLAVIELSLQLSRDGLVIEVRDSSPDVPVHACAPHDAEHGRGLMLVDALSQEWGYWPDPRGGKVVYAVLPFPLTALAGRVPSATRRQHGD